MLLGCFSRLLKCRFKLRANKVEKCYKWEERLRTKEEFERSPRKWSCRLQIKWYFHRFNLSQQREKLNFSWESEENFSPCFSSSLLLEAFCWPQSKVELTERWPEESSWGRLECWKICWCWVSIESEENFLQCQLCLVSENWINLVSFKLPSCSSVTLLAELQQSNSEALQAKEPLISLAFTQHWIITSFLLRSLSNFCQLLPTFARDLETWVSFLELN